MTNIYVMFLRQDQSIWVTIDKERQSLSYYTPMALQGVSSPSSTRFSSFVSFFSVVIYWMVSLWNYQLNPIQ